MRKIYIEYDGEVVYMEHLSISSTPIEILRGGLKQPVQDIKGHYWMNSPGLSTKPSTEIKYYVTKTIQIWEEED